MTEREMFENSFQRPTNFFLLTSEQQWKIDEDLGLLDWHGSGLSQEDMQRFKNHYEQKNK